MRRSRRAIAHDSNWAHWASLNSGRLFGGRLTKETSMRRSRRAIAHESNWGALGIPEFRPPIRRQAYKVNL